jgi:transcriptional regulator with XRE-family HTH domain
VGKAISVDALLREIGLRMRSSREAAGLTQEEAAHRAGLDARRWQRIEQGVVNLTVRTLARISSALEVSFWDLLRKP